MSQETLHRLIVLPLPQASDPEALFTRIVDLPHCLWLDSASDRQFNRGRYSFLTADPVAWCSAYATSPDPWPVLVQWCRGLERLAFDHGRDLPPFRGGVAGLIAYDAARWLEPTAFEHSRWDETTPTMAIGLYDWVITIDHPSEQAWLISTGIDETLHADVSKAQFRADQVLEKLSGPNHELTRKTSEGQGDRSLSEPRPLSPTLFPTGHPGVQSNFATGGFADAVDNVIQRITAGDSFQVNLAQTLFAESERNPDAIYLQLREQNPAPYAAYLDAGEYQVLSSSPEGFLQVRDRQVTTRPIKGTVPRTGDLLRDEQLGDQLLSSKKDRAENIMIVDLMRNDLSRVCEDATVEVTGLCELERYQSVQHLVSTVCGRMRDDVTVAELLSATFPGGSITGAPKVEAMRTISQMEGMPRGPYCGSLGYISVSGHADFNILIRTITQWGRSLRFPVGGGITARSDPDQETAETWAKANRLIATVTEPLG